MPPQFQIQELRSKLNEIELLLKTHKHASFDLTTPLTNLDFNLIARTSLPAAASSIILDGIPPKRFFRVIVYHGAKTVNGNTLLRFNGDASNNYSSISRENNTARTSASSVDLMDALNNTAAFFYVIDILNLFGSTKTIISEGIQQITATSATQITRQVYGTWVSTTANITRIDVVASAGNFPADSFLYVYGSRD